MKKSYDVAVVFGGVSGENEVSVITGTLVCNVLKKGGKSVLPVYISQKGETYIDERLAQIELFKREGYRVCARGSVAEGGAVVFSKRGKPKRRIRVECAINCCHGSWAEGGGISGLFIANGIPLASAGLFESAAFMDKYYTKLVLASLGVNIVPYVYSRDIQGAIAGAERLGYPVIVKPAALGSSIGIGVAENEESLRGALETAFSLDCAVLVEKYMSPCREINCAAYYHRGRAVTSPCEEVAGGGKLLSFDDKYTGGGRRTFPAKIGASEADFIRAETARVYAALNMRGIVRFDYILSGGKIFVSEINTVPGSLSYYLLSDGFSDFCGVLLKLLSQAKADFAERQKKLVITTGILNNLNTNACKLK